MHFERCFKMNIWSHKIHGQTLLSDHKRPDGGLHIHFTIAVAGCLEANSIMRTSLEVSLVPSDAQLYLTTWPKWPVVPSLKYLVRMICWMCLTLSPLMYLTCLCVAYQGLAWALVLVATLKAPLACGVGELEAKPWWPQAENYRPCSHLRKIWHWTMYL